MDKIDIAEQAYKNGYLQALKDFVERLKYKDLCVPLKDEFIIICKKDIEEICRELTELDNVDKRRKN